MKNNTLFDYIARPVLALGVVAVGGLLAVTVFHILFPESSSFNKGDVRDVVYRGLCAPNLPNGFAKTMNKAGHPCILTPLIAVPWDESGRIKQVTCTVEVLPSPIGGPV